MAPRRHDPSRAARRFRPSTASVRARTGWSDDLFGAREVGMKTVMVESDQGTNAHLDCVPDYTITDFRDLLRILGLA
jgi:hypothetical protein